MDKLPTFNESFMEIFNIFSSVFENHQIVPSKPDSRSTLLILDTGVPFGLTSFRSDFINYIKADIPVKDVTNVNWVVGIGNTIHKKIDVNGTTCYFTCVSYHLLSIYVQLFSPHTYHKIHV